MNDILVAALQESFPLGLLLKSTLVLAMAGLVALALYRASAATRHLVWAVGVGGLLTLPLLAVLLPRWEVPVEVAATTAVPPAIPTAQVTSTPSVAAVPEQPVVGSAGAATPTGVGQSAATPTPPMESANVAGISFVRGSVDGGEAGGLGLARLLFLLWGAGTAIFIVRLGAGWFGVRRLAHSAMLVTEPEWGELLNDARWLLDVDRDVTLLRSSRVSMPITWGTLRPTILLPVESDDWSTERRRVVLLHEMAHVARRDCAVQQMADLVCAVYWFHPLAWIAASRLRSERERACDDLVLTAGEHAADYAGHLLEVARAYRSRWGMGAAAIAMARPSQLEGRLLAVLDSARSRKVPGRRTRLMSIAVALVLITPIAALRAVDARAATMEEEGLLADIRDAIAAGEELVGSARRGSNAAITAERDTVFEHTLSASPGGTIVIDLRTGGNVSIVGWGENSVHLRGEVTGRDAEDVIVEFGPSGTNEIRLAARYDGRESGRRSNANYELRVPTSSNLDVSNGGGNLVIQGVSGSFTGGTGGGDIHLERLSGQSSLRTGGGDIVISDSQLDGEATTGGGDIRVSNNAGDLRAQTGGGNIRIDRASTGAQGSTAQMLEFRTGGGNIALTDLPGGAEITTGGGNIDIRSAGGPVRAETGGGDINIERIVGGLMARTGSGEVEVGAAGGPVEVSTGAGDVTVAVAPGQGARDIEISAGTGDITLVLPPDFSGEFDVRIDGVERGARDALQSDFEFAIESSRGPFGPLHATGRTGSGTNRVAIRTGFGSVRILSSTNAAASAVFRETDRDADIDLDLDVEQLAELQRLEQLEVELENLQELEHLESLDRTIQEAVHRGLAAAAGSVRADEVGHSMAAMGLDVARNALEAAAAAMEEAAAQAERSRERREEARERLRER